MSFKEAKKCLRRMIKAYKLSKYPEDIEDCKALEIALQALKEWEKWENKDGV